MRVGIVDIGTNSTRLLIADVHGGDVGELRRESIVTRLGSGVDATGELAPEAMERVFAVLARYREALDAAGCERTTAILTSAVRDARNGADFSAAVRERFGLEARTIAGGEEALLTFTGVAAGREAGTARVVIDIGGGSTELVVGAGGAVSFHVSTQTGVVRHTERHLHTDPPEPEQLQELAADARQTIEAAIAAEPAPPGAVQAGVAVAGTATSCAAIAQELEPYDAAAVEGFRLTEGWLELALARLAGMPLAERRVVPGLHPDRAPTIVAGVAILLEAMRIFGLEEVEVSERDILWGAALRLAGEG